MVGQKAATKWQPQVSQLELELQELRTKNDQRVLSETPKETITERIASDPEFARRYSDTVNADSVLAEQRRQQAVANQILADIELATEQGLPFEKAQEIYQGVSEGKFDVDAEGNQVDENTAFQMFRSTLFSELRSSGQSAPAATPTEVTAPPVSVEDALDTASPDVGPSGGTSTGGPTFTAVQVAEMNPEELIINFPNDGDMEQAVREGRITGISREAKSVYD